MSSTKGLREHHADAPRYKPIWVLSKQEEDTNNDRCQRREQHSPYALGWHRILHLHFVKPSYGCH
eukprot:scaffold201_cov405-Prasinococcus_capsulatus_cf.AAC.40